MTRQTRVFIAGMIEGASFVSSAFAIATLIVLLSGCGPTCKTGASRCKGNTVQTCSPDGWRKTINCDKVTPGRWVCAQGTKVCYCKRGE